MNNMNGLTFIVITGMSGAGKSTVANVFEDLGYYTIDNLPVPIINHFLDIFNELVIQNNTKIAMVIDARSGDGGKVFYVINRMRNEFGAKVIFIDANEDVLIRRYKESRRKHPMSLGLEESIELESNLLREVKSIADLVIDTSTLNVHELKSAVTSFFEEQSSNMLVTVNSFGFKHGVPVDSDMVFDVRFMKNPYFTETMRHKTGMDQEVRDYVMDDNVATEFLDKLKNMIIFLIPQYQKEGKAFLVISIGCTGGHHRSVTIAELLAKHISNLPALTVKTKHRDIEK